MKMKVKSKKLRHTLRIFWPEQEILRDCDYTGWGKSMFMVICMENNATINNNRRVNSVFQVT